MFYVNNQQEKHFENLSGILWNRYGTAALSLFLMNLQTQERKKQMILSFKILEAFSFNN